MSEENCKHCGLYRPCICDFERINAENQVLSNDLKYARLALQEIREALGCEPGMSTHDVWTRARVLVEIEKHSISPSMQRLIDGAYI